MVQGYGRIEVRRYELFTLLLQLTPRIRSLSNEDQDSCRYSGVSRLIAATPLHHRCRCAALYLLCFSLV